MSTHLVTFASPDMSRAASLCHRSAKTHGVEGDILHFSPFDFNGHCGGLTEVHEIYDANKSLFDAPRGCGYWAWKPLFLYYYALLFPFIRDINEGDVVIYSDAGVEFIDNVNYIIDRMDQDIFLFGNMYDHKDWCKRDIVEAVWPDYRMQTVRTDDDYKYRTDQMWQRFGKQVQASVIFFRVNDTTRAFVKEWLDWCLFEGGRLIDDSPSRLPNHPEFQENRHDQAILTTLAYREGIRLHYWPSRYNMDQPGGGFVYPRGDYPDDGIPLLFHHHRRRDHEWPNL